MDDQAKTREDLTADLQNLRKRIAEQESIEQALRESESRFRRLSEATLEGIVIHDRGKILESNDAFARMLGYEPCEIVGMSVLDIFTAESRELVLRNISSGHDKPYEADGTKKDGSAFQLEIVAKNISYKGMNARVAAVRDITERKLVEQEREKLQAQLYQADKMTTVGLLAAGLAHEINNPIGFVLPNLEFLQEQFAIMQEIVNLHERGAAESEISEFRKANELTS